MLYESQYVHHGEEQAETNKVPLRLLFVLLNA